MNRKLEKYFIRPFNLKYYEADQKPAFQSNELKSLSDSGEDLIKSILQSNDINEVKELAKKLVNSYQRIITIVAGMEIEANKKNESA